MAKGKRIVDCGILLAECSVREAILMTIRKDIHRIIIQSDSQVNANSINGKILVPKDIVDLVEDVRKLLVLLNNSKVEFYHRKTNCEPDRLIMVALI